MEVIIEEAELLRRYAEHREENAFAELVQRRIDLVYSAALRRTNGNAMLAQDATQQVFIAVAQQAHALSGHPTLTGWFYTATKNAAANLMRGVQRRERLAEEAQQLGAVDATGREPNWDDLRPVLDGAMDKLNADDRQIILWRFFEGRTLADIGTTLSLKENTARMRVDRALERLRAHLQRRGIHSTAAALGLVIGQNSIAAAPVGLASSIASAAMMATGTAAVTTISAIAFMSINKIVLSTAAAIAVVGTGIGWYESQLAGKNERELKALSASHQFVVAQVSELETKLETEKKSASVRSAQLASLQQELEAAKKNALAKPVPLARRDTMAPFANPDYARAYLERTRALMSAKYQPFYRSLHLTSEQIEKFENVLFG